MKKAFKEYWELLLTLIVVVGTIMFMCCGCNGASHLSETKKIVRDTVYISSVEHDTIKKVEVVHDSVDRVVEIITYVDSNGVVHQKEIERLTCYINHNVEAYESTARLLQEKIASLTEQLKTGKDVIVKEKKVYVWWPCWVVLGIAALLGLWWLVERFFNKLAKEVGEE